MMILTFNDNFLHLSLEIPVNLLRFEKIINYATHAKAEEHKKVARNNFTALGVSYGIDTKHQTYRKRILGTCWYLKNVLAE